VPKADEVKKNKDKVTSTSRSDFSLLPLTSFTGDGEPEETRG
jgi:hypothetical protein